MTYKCKTHRNNANKLCIQYVIKSNIVMHAIISTFKLRLSSFYQLNLKCKHFTSNIIRSTVYFKNLQKLSPISAETPRERFTYLT